MPGMLPLKICLPSPAARPPAGPDWLHEIKRDGFRMIARRDGERVQLISRRGIEHGDLVVENIGVTLIPIQAFLENRLIVDMEG